MERFDLAAGLREKPVSSRETARRALAANRRYTEKEKKAKNSFCSGKPCTCGRLESALARENGSNPNDPYAMYTPGRYIRGC